MNALYWLGKKTEAIVLTLVNLFKTKNIYNASELMRRYD